MSTPNPGNNFYKAHADFIDLAEKMVSDLQRLPKDAFAQKKIQILQTWLKNRKRFETYIRRKNNRFDLITCKNGNCGNAAEDVPVRNDYVDSGGDLRNFHPCKAESLFRFANTKYRIWFTRSGQEERVHDPVFGLLYVPDGRVFMPLAWLGPNKTDLANTGIRYVESLPSPMHADNVIHYEEFDLGVAGERERIQEVLLACAVNNAGRMQFIYSNASDLKEEETAFWENRMPAALADKKKLVFRDPLTLNCYCRQCSKGRLLPRRAAMGLTVLTSIIDAGNGAPVYSPETKTLIQSYFAPTINPTGKDYKYTISTQNFINDLMDKLRDANKAIFDYQDEEDSNLGFWKIGEENTRFTMSELANALPNNVYKLLMEHEIDTAAFGMWTTASFLGTATHNALDMAYVIHEKQPRRLTGKNTKSRSQAVDITRAYPGICTLSATSAYDFWVNRTLRVQTTTAMYVDGTATGVNFLCADSALHPECGKAFVFPQPHFKNNSGVIMRPDYYFPVLECVESEAGEGSVFTAPLENSCAGRAFYTPLRAGQAASAGILKGARGVVVEYKTRWGRKQIDKLKIFQYKLQALTQAIAANAGIAILHITTIPYIATTNDVKNEIMLTDAQNSKYTKVIKDLLAKEKKSTADAARIDYLKVMPMAFKFEYEENEDITLYSILFSKGEDDNGLRFFRAETPKKTLYFKPSAFAIIDNNVEIKKELSQLSDVLHACMVNV